MNPVHTVATVAANVDQNASLCVKPKAAASTFANLLRQYSRSAIRAARCASQMVNIAARCETMDASIAHPTACAAYISAKADAHSAKPAPISSRETGWYGRSVMMPSRMEGHT